MKTCFQFNKTKMSKKQNPSDFLKQIIGKPVVVKLNSGVDYRGWFVCYISLMLVVCCFMILF